MNAEKQRIAIAEACGWTDITRGSYDGSLFGRHKTHRLEIVPDYLNDLNAMHEAEKVLNQMQARANGDHLAESEQNKTWASCHIWHQSAAQRAEAFLRTLGKWEDNTTTTK